MRLPPFIRTYRFLVLMVIGLFTLNIVLIYHMLHPDNRRIVENFFLPMTSVDNPSDIDIAASEEGRCNVTNPQAQKTLARVQSDQCRRLITTAACSMQSNTFIPTALPTSCPRSDRENAGRYLGCFADSRNDRLLRGSAMQLPRT
uniref:Uncharacterized protein n=1 Tax=Plectus sambesii TaxID=2011161 RepID=A0A914VUL9_9BILA